MDFNFDNSFKLKNSIIFNSPSNEESAEIKKILLGDEPTGILTRNPSQLLSKSSLNNISKNKTDWITGLTTVGYEVYVIVALNKNYIFNAIDGKLLVCIKPFLHVEEYNSTIISGILTLTDQQEMIFVAEDAEIYCEEKLSTKNFDERYKKLFEFKYDKSANITLSIMTLYSVKHVKELMLNLEVPFKTNGLTFFRLNNNQCCLQSRGEILWKRAQDYTVNFNVRKSADHQATQNVAQGTELRTVYKFEMLLKNCKKSTQVSSDNRYSEFDGKVATAMFFDNQWVLTKLSPFSATSTNQYKIILSAIKENIELMQVYKALE